MRLIDSHCHVHDREFFGDKREEVYQRAIAEDIGMVCVGTDEVSSRDAIEFVKNREMSWAVIGVHPHEAKLGCSEIEGMLSQSDKIVGIGEIGLDYFYDNSPREKQIEVLETQLQIANDNNLPVSFHVRDAFDDFWPIFDNFSGIKGVLHSFTDTMANAEAGMSRGLFIGVNGISTFTKDVAQQEMFRNLPIEKILLETDAPFLTPKPFRGKMNEVGYVELVAKWHADERGITLGEIAETTRHNTRDLFRI